MEITCSKPPTSLISKIQVFEPEWTWFLHVCPLELRSKKSGMERTIGVSQIPGFILKFHMEVISKIQVFEPEWNWFLHVCPLELRFKKSAMERTIGVSQIPGFILKFHMEVISKIQVFEPEWKWFLHVCPLELRSKRKWDGKNDRCVPNSRVYPQIPYGGYIENPSVWAWVEMVSPCLSLGIEIEKKVGWKER